MTQQNTIEEPINEQQSIEEQYSIFNEISTAMVATGRSPAALFMPLANFLVMVAVLLGVSEDDLLQGIQLLFRSAKEEEQKLMETVGKAKDLTEVIRAADASL